jgi:two-component system, LytTR family, response regulator
LPESQSLVSSTESPLPRKIRVLIVDDEPLARSNLLLLLRRDPDIEIVGEASSGARAITEIRGKAPDLVFLDVQMPECDGFDVLEGLGTDLPPTIVFVTAYAQYALRAFEAGALDYLLKPFDNARFEKTVSRVKDVFARQDGLVKKANRLAIKGSGQIMFVNISDIDWIEAADYYSCLHVGNRTHLLRRSMADLEAELDGSRFCRVHRSTIVNLERVAGLRLDGDGEHKVVLHDGTRLRLSRACRKELQSRLGVGTRENTYS